MKTLISVLIASALSSGAYATQPENHHYNGSNQEHTCHGGHNCNDGGGSADASSTSTAASAAVAASTSSSSASVAVDSSNVNQNANVNSNTAEGGAAYASQTQGQVQGISNSGNSSNYTSSGAYNDGNNSSQSTSINFEAAQYRKNTPGAIAPNVYASGICSGGGFGAGASGPGYGMSIGGNKTDKQCQARENARMLAGVGRADLALLYLCRQGDVDIGATLGAACAPLPEPEPPVVILPVEPTPDPPVVILDDKVKG